MLLHRISMTTALLAMVTLTAASTAFGLADDSYTKVTDSKDVVKDKLYPKKGRFEIAGPSLGLIMNQSYVNTYLIQGGAQYFPNETWGIGAEIMIGINSDKSERECIETFYMDPYSRIGPECGSQGDPGSDLDPSLGGKYGPAYVNIREIKYIAAANYIWTPIYGKQLFMLSATSYFDFFVIIGGGIVGSDFYAQRDTLNNNKAPRGEAVNKGTATNPEFDISNYGADPSETDSYGVAGRPAPEAQTNLLLNLGIGQKYHFAKRFYFKAELRNFTLLGTPSGFDNLFALWGGIGVRF